MIAKKISPVKDFVWIEHTCERRFSDLNDNLIPRLVGED